MLFEPWCQPDCGCPDEIAYPTGDLTLTIEYDFYEPGKVTRISYDITLFRHLGATYPYWRSGPGEAFADFAATGGGEYRFALGSGSGQCRHPTGTCGAPSYNGYHRSAFSTSPLYAVYVSKAGTTICCGAGATYNNVYTITE